MSTKIVQYKADICSSKKHKNDKTAMKSMGFSLGKTIGEGTYSKVCLATSKNSDTPRKVACKVIQKKYAGSEFVDKFLPRELRIVRKLHHSNIVKVYNVFEALDTIYMVMDYCENGDLLEFVRSKGPLDEELAKYFFRQLVDAVYYIHGLNVAHRDLKCENVLISERNLLKLADFGFSRSSTDEDGECVLSDTFCGSAAYAAPEIIQGIPYEPKMYDIWALGCILYIMITASMPFDDTNVKKMLKNQLNRSLCINALDSWTCHSIQLRNLISYLLEPDVNERATIKQIANCMWVRDQEPQQDEEFQDVRGSSSSSSSPYSLGSIRAFLQSHLSSSTSIF